VPSSASSVEVETVIDGSKGNRSRQQHRPGAGDAKKHTQFGPGPMSGTPSDGIPSPIKTTPTGKGHDYASAHREDVHPLRFTSLHRGIKHDGRIALTQAEGVSGAPTQRDDFLQRSSMRSR
jgi:hypothetical protein